MAKKQNKTAAPAAHNVAVAVVSVPDGADEAAVLNSIMSDLANVDEQFEANDGATTFADSGDIIEPRNEAADAGVSTDEGTGVADPVEDLLNDAAAESQRMIAQGDATANAALTGNEAEIDNKADKAAAKKAAAEKRKAAAAEAKKNQPPRPTSVTHKPGDLMVAKLGGNWRDYIVFNNTDIDADDETRTAKQDAFVARMNDKDAIADKVREKIIMLMTWMQRGGAPADLNEVLKRTFTLLHKDGSVTSGDKGTLQLNLLSKPYTIGTARSQANQMFVALPELGITIKEKGKMSVNPDSVLYPMIVKQLGLQ